jgi:uncharacterized protein (DUF433 family)
MKRRPPVRELIPGVVSQADVRWGEPTTKRLRIPCWALVSMFRAGDSVADVARWYDLEPAEVEAALRWALLDRRARKRRMEGK